MEMELVLKTSRKSDKNMAKNEAFTDETEQTNQQNPIFQIWLTWFFENKGDFWKFYSFLETITITIKITTRNVIINYKIFQVITVLSRDSSSTVTEDVSR